MCVCGISFPLKFGIGGRGDHSSIGAWLKLSGLGEGLIEHGHNPQARQGTNQARGGHIKKCAFLRWRGEEHGCTIIDFGSL